MVFIFSLIISINIVLNIIQQNKPSILRLKNIHIIDILSNNNNYQMIDFSFEN
jgi:hypothetical protein